jgi:hypothetical protein
MQKKKLHAGNLLALSALITLFGVAAPASGQTAPATGSASAQDQNNNEAQPRQDPTGYGKDNDTTRGELAQFNRFLESHPDIAQEIRKDPSAVNNYAYVHNHPALLSYLNDHPALAEEVKEDPYNFMSQEKQFEQREGQPGIGRDNDATRAERAQFDQFLDSHREIEEQVRKNPSLVNNQPFVENHPALMTYLQQHPEVRQELRSNPATFMQPRDKGQFDRRDDRNRGEIARFDQFLDGHREIAEQVRKNPALLNDDRFAKGHPVLQAYLQDHPGIRDEARDNPNAFLHQEDQFDRNERNGYGGNPEMAHDRSADFRQFLNGHADIAQQLSHNPSLATDKDYMRNHPEFQDYLKTHPDVNQELMNNPDSFIKSAQPPPLQPQQFDKTDPGVKTPSYDPKAMR